jgi:Rod binding domain-containing protein
MGDPAIGRTAPVPAVPIDQDAALRKAAKQLESVFLRELMKPMEESGLDDGEELIGGSEGEKEWKRLQLDALADKAAGGIGIAELLVRELSLKQGRPPAGGPDRGAQP